MRSLFGLATFMFATTACNVSFSQDIRWERSFGGRQADFLFDAVPTADYGFILAGGSLSGKSGNKTDAGRGDLDYCIWKMDEQGETEWQRSYGGTGNDLLRSVVLTGDGGFILAGTSDSPKGLDKKDGCRGGNDFWVIKLDAAGGEKWQRTIGGSQQDDLAKIIQTRDGGYLIGGTSYSGLSGEKRDESRGSGDYWLVKLSPTGEFQWQKTYGGSRADQLKDLAEMPDGSFIAGGYSNSGNEGDKTDKTYGSGDYWILKLDKTGGLLWQKTLGGNMDDDFSCLKVTYDNGILIGGTSNSTASNNKTVSAENGSDIWLAKLDTDGQILWQESYDFGPADILTTISEDADHTLLLGGFAKNDRGGKDEEGENDYIIIKADEKGQVLWQKFIGSAGEDILRKLIETRDGGYVLAGTSNPEHKPSVPGKSRKGPGKGVNIRQENNKAVEGLNRQMDDAVQGQVARVNDAYKEQAQNALDQANRAVADNVDSRLKVGGQASDILGAQNKGGLPGTSNASQGGPKPGLAASRDKKTSFGSNDFWVVKLKDKDKKEKTPSPIEAFPNPATDYTNIIVGFEYTKGWATVYDLSGHQLQRFKLSGERTVPVNLSSLSEGIYLVEIGTDKGSNTVKIIKSILRNE